MAHAQSIQDELDASGDLFKSPPICIFGKKVPIPRGQTAFGSGTYTYSGMSITAHTPPAHLQVLMTTVQRLMGTRMGPKFQYILANKYDGGQQSVGRHADDETGLVHGAPIVSYSLGISRRFLFRSSKVDRTLQGPLPITSLFDPWQCPGIPENRRADLAREVPYSKWVFEVDAAHNTMIAMCGRFQKEFVHEVPKAANVRGVRYNLTLRATT